MLIAATLLLAAVAALLAAELLLRGYVALRGWTANVYAASLQLFEPHEAVGLELARGFELRSGVYTITTNSHGLRGPEVTRGKPEATVRVAILGESSAFGYLVSDERTAAAELQRLLNQAGQRRGAALRVEVLNGGVPGFNLYHTTHRFRERIEPLAPDFVVLYLGWNDLPYVVSDEPRAARFQVRRAPPRWQRCASHSTLYGFVAHRLLGTDPPLAPPRGQATDITEAGAAQFRDNFRRLAADVERSGAELVVCAQAMAAHPRADADMRRWLAVEPDRWNATIELGQWLQATLRALADERGAAFVDVYERIEPTPEHLADYIHLTELGERRLAALWAEALQPRILDVERLADAAARRKGAR